MSISSAIGGGPTIEARVVLRAQYLDMAQAFIKNSDEYEWAAGIYVEPHRDRGATIVASDGTTMAVWHDAVGFCTQPTWLKMSKPIVRSFPISATDRKAGIGRWLFLTRTSDGQWLASVRKGPLIKTGEQPSTSRAYQQINADEIFCSEIISRLDTPYPKWRDVIPSVISSGEGVAISAGLLQRFAQVRPDDNENPGVTFMGIGPKQILVNVAGLPEFFGIAFRRPSDSSLPAWARSTPLILNTKPQ